MKRKNSFGIKFLKSLLFIIVAVIIAVFITPSIFSVLAPLIWALPFQTPTSFIIADYAGMIFMALEGLVILVYAKKWAWR